MNRLLKIIISLIGGLIAVVVSLALMAAGFIWSILAFIATVFVFVALLIYEVLARTRKASNP